MEPIKKGDIVLRKAADKDGEWREDHYRVEMVIGNNASLRNLTNYTVSKEPVDTLGFLYHTGTYDRGDIVRVRENYRTRYNEADGNNDLTVVRPTANITAPTVRVENNNGDEFDILSERVFLVCPAASFKEGDRVVVDPELVKKYSGDGVSQYWYNVGVLVLTEDSGSRSVQTTSHIRYENRDDSHTNNVPTRWLKLYEEPAKRVVGEAVRTEDIKVGDTIRATYVHSGMTVSSDGVVNRVQQLASAEQAFFTEGGARFPLPYVGTVYTLLEEAPEPVDENLQRLLDAEVGDIAHGTYADEYWKKLGEDQWRLIRDEDSQAMIRNAEGVFGSLYKLKYGELFFYKKV